jgi:hypothetical protein
LTPHAGVAIHHEAELISREEPAMRMSWLVLAVWLACGRAGAPWQQGHAAAPPVQQPYEVVLDRPKPPTPTDPVDVAVRPDLGKAARWWGFVGSFNQNGWGVGMCPNFFSLHAATRDNRGRWVGQKVCSCTRCRFGRILDRGESSVAVELRPEWYVHVGPKWSPAEREEWLKIAVKANTPFTVTLSIRDGRPVASASPSR